MYILNASMPGRAGMSGLGLMAPRVNQAVERGVYYFPTHTTVRSLHGLGQSTISTPLLIGAIAAIGLGVYFFTGKKSNSRRRIARLASERTRISQQLKQMGA